jgi:hypothetical protein
MPDGFQVDLPGIRKYSGTLTGDKALAAEVDGLVGQSDVGDESWGVVGLFVKSTYTDMLGELTDLLKEMQDGLQSVLDKMDACVETYNTIDEGLAKIFNDALAEMEAADKGGI